MPDDRFVIQGGRRKAYRPLPPAERRAALAEGLAAIDDRLAALAAGDAPGSDVAGSLEIRLPRRR